MTTYVVLAALRLGLVVALTVVVARLIYRLERTSPPLRLPTSPRLRHGLMALALGSAGLSILTLMRLLAEALPGFPVNWPLFTGGRDAVGELASFLCAVLFVGGLVELLRGVRDLIFRKVP
jgi:hypothetical protein